MSLDKPAPTRAFFSCDSFCLLDAHAPAGVLKLWYRELYDPLIPDSFYEESIKADDPKDVLAIVDRLPEINRNVSGAVKYLW